MNLFVWTQNAHSCALLQAVLEDEKITAFVISRIEAEKDGATNDVKVREELLEYRSRLPFQKLT